MRKNFLSVMKSVVIIGVAVMLFSAVACSSKDKKQDATGTSTVAPITSVSPVVTSTATPSPDREGEIGSNSAPMVETILPVETLKPTESIEIPTKQPEITATEDVVATPAETSEPTAKPVVTEVPVHTPITPAEKEEIIKDLAASFFHGEWESESGMLYIFDSNDSTVVLKEKKTGEVLLSGTYESSSDDYSEYELTMTFNGESDTYIAWKYSDTGAVRLIIGETGATYDLLWRAS